MKTMDRARKARAMGEEIIRLEERLIKKIEAYNKKFGQVLWVESTEELDAMTKEDLKEFDSAQTVVRRVSNLKYDLGV